jgi:hypothetical protein
LLEELVKLLEIQRLDQKIERLDQKLAEVPRGIEAVEADLIKKRARLDAALARIIEAEKKKKRLELDIEEGRERAVKLDGQLMSVKTNQEYRAMLSQIQTLREQSSDQETEILVLMEQLDQLQAEKAEASAEFKSFEATAGDEIGKRRAHGEVLARDRHEALERRGELASSLDKKLSAQYEKVRKKWGNTVVVELRGEICSGCHLSLRPQHANFVKQGQEIYTCENCYRILYHPEPRSEEQEQVGS